MTPELHRTIWRWHFYAGLLVMPLILSLSITGAIYLFKPQIDRWEEREWRELSTTGAVSANAQADAALAAHPGARFVHYRLPELAGDAAMIHLEDAPGKAMIDVFVSPQGRVLASLNPETRISAFVSRLHGSLLLGRVGDWLVELAACWAIVMIATGLYLWWPRGAGPAGIVWPRLSARGRLFWRDLHAVTGFWVAGLALVLLTTGLPWAGVWGDLFTMAREQTGLITAKPDWRTGSPHAEHDHQAMLRAQAAGVPLTSLDTMAQRARAENLPYPALVVPPGPTGQMAWTIKSQSQNRPLNRSIVFDANTGAELSRSGFADKHPIDQAVNYGIAWHEGQLFGWVNQLIGLLTALALLTVTVSGFVMWRKRKPDGVLGAPQALGDPVRTRGVVAIMLLLALLLPLFALSLAALWLAEKLILPCAPRAARWLGATT